MQGIHRWGAGALVVAALAVAPDSARAEFKPDCANQDKAMASLSVTKAEKVLLCIFNGYTRSKGDGKVAANKRVRTAAKETLRKRDYRIKSIVKELSKAGYFSSGGKGFRRCSALKFDGDDTVEDVGMAIIRYEFFIFDPPHRDVGIAIRKNQLFVIVGRRK